MKTLKNTVPPATPRIALLSVSLAGAILVVLYGMNFSTKRLSDFAGYYTASRILLTGDSLSRVYDDNWFLEKSRAFGIRETTSVFYVNPPTMSAVYLPVASLEPFAAKIVWNVTSVALLLLLWFGARDLLGASSSRGNDALLLILMTWSIPLLRNLQRGQVYVVMLFLVIALYRGYTSNQPWLLAISLAMMILLKYFGWLFLVLIALERRWGDLGRIIILTSAGLIVSVSMLGTQVYIHHFDRILAVLNSSGIASSDLPCVPALLGTIVGSHQGAISPDGSLRLASLLSLISLASAVVLTLRKGNALTLAEKKYRFFALLVLSIIFTPLAADHHYVMMSVPLFVYASSLDLQQLGLWKLGGLALMTYLVIGWFPSPASYQQQVFITFAPFLRLYGAISVWFVLAYFVRVSEKG